MAKAKDDITPDAPIQHQQTNLLPSHPVQPPQPASADDLARANDEIVRLRERLAKLQAEKKPDPFFEAGGSPGLYRVQLLGTRVLNPSVTVTPHDRRAKPERKHARLAATYNGLELYLSCKGRMSLQDAAWSRFLAEQSQRLGKGEDPLTEADRHSFSIRVEAGQSLDALEIPANSAAEAQAIFVAFNGILSTAEKFITEAIAPQKAVA